MVITWWFPCVFFFLDFQLWALSSFSLPVCVRLCVYLRLKSFSYQFNSIKLRILCWAGWKCFLKNDAEFFSVSLSISFSHCVIKSRNICVDLIQLTICTELFINWAVKICKYLGIIILRHYSNAIIRSNVERFYSNNIKAILFVFIVRIEKKKLGKKKRSV